MSTIQPPRRVDTLREIRTWEVFPRLALELPRLGAQQRGNGEPVMTVPGFRANDHSTGVIRRYLRYLGYTTKGWGLGTNRGNVEALLPQLIEQVEAYAGEAQSKIRLVGWSLGGYLSREVARDRPDLVDRVITMGSPVIGGPKYTAAARTYQRWGFDLNEIEALVEERYTVPIEVPVTALYSRADGVVAWQACVDERSPNVEHIEVRGTHLSLGFSPEVLRLVAQKLQ